MYKDKKLLFQIKMNELYLIQKLINENNLSFFKAIQK